MPKPRRREAYLLVEGEDDQHVVWHLCEQHGLPEIFTVEMPETGGGIADLLDGLTNRINAPDLRTLGIMVDADVNLSARWRSLRDRLRNRDKQQDRAYSAIPARPPHEGWISAEPHLPRVGIWLMPNNRLPGMLEDFAAQLIPANDQLLPKAEAILQEIEGEGLHRYSLAHIPKALIHTWLAWQQTPGHPMGTAIAARALRHDASLALEFIGWLRRLFDLPAA
jgi:hypothetical protein